MIQVCIGPESFAVSEKLEKDFGFAQDPDGPRHLVQFLAVAVCDNGLAGADRDPEEVLSDDRSRDRAGHYFSSGSRA